MYRGKEAFRVLIPAVAEAVPLTNIEYVASTVGGDYVIEIVEFTLAHGHGRVEATEVIRFRGNQICEVRPFYFDPTPMITAAARRKSAEIP